MFDHSLRESLMLLIWLNLFKDDRVIALMGLLFVIVVFFARVTHLKIEQNWILVFLSKRSEGRGRDNINGSKVHA